MIKGYHMQLVLDYIYGGAMYLCGAHMQFVIQVMEVLQLKCGVSVNKIVGGSSGEFIEVEHSTVTIKTDAEQQEVKHQVNGLKDEEGSGNYRLRRKSTTDNSAVPSKVLKTKPVKRRRQSGVDTTKEREVEKESDNNNRESLTKKLPVTLEITPVLGSNKSSASSTSSVESPPSPDKPVAKAVEENVDDDEDEGNDVVMVELDEEFVVEKVESKTDTTDTSPSQDEATAVEVNGDEGSRPAHR